MELHEVAIYTDYLTKSLIERWVEAEAQTEDQGGKILSVLDHLEAIERVCQTMADVSRPLKVHPTAILPPRAEHIFARVFHRSTEEWPVTLKELVALAYGKQWEGRSIKWHNLHLTFAEDLQRGGRIFLSDLFLAWKMLEEIVPLSDSVIDRKSRAGSNVCNLFLRWNYRSKRRRIFEYLQRLGAIPTSVQFQEE